MKTGPILGALLLAAACSASSGPLDVSAGDTCTFCRMAISDQHFAAQIAVPGEEPRLFDDVGCMVNWLRDNRAGDASAAFVADHRTSRWVPAMTAVFTRSATVSTPMGSGILAHADAASRDQDAAARNGQAISLAELRPAGSRGGSRDR